MTIVRLENLEDPRLRVFSSYTDGELRDGRQMVGLALAAGISPEQLSAGLFIAESRNVIQRAMASGLAPFAFLVEECWEAQAAPLVERVEADLWCARESGEMGAIRGDGCTDADSLGCECMPSQVPVFIASRAQVKELTGFERTRGPLAAFLRPVPVPLEALLVGAHRVVVLEGVTNYTNIGAIFRSAAALGVDAVLLDPTCHDPLYRRAARVSMGAVFQVPWGRVPALANCKGEGCSRGEAHEGKLSVFSTVRNAVCAEQAACGREASGLELLKGLGFKTVALALTDDSVSIEDQRLKCAEKLALVLGNEEHGLSPATIAACDYTAKIPMAHGVDSLNVAAAAAVAFWELRAR